MSSRDQVRMLAALGALIDGSHLVVPDQLPRVIDEAFEPLGWRVVVYLVDFDQQTLRPIDPIGKLLDEESVAGSLAGRCFRHSVPIASRQPQPHTWIPLIDGVDRLGVVRLELPPQTTLDDPTVEPVVRWAVYLIAHLIASKSLYTDYFHRVRLSGQRSVPSELIWSVLPPLTVAAEGIAISGWLEPNGSVAGDIFDYAIDGQTAHFAIADATGHDLNAAVVGALIMAAYRSGRRRSADLPAVLEGLDRVLASYADDTYASAVFAELDVRSGVLRYVNAGHPFPLLMRGGKVVKSLDGGRRILLGFPGRPVTVGRETLEPGDWVVLYTDGVTEARDTDGRMFGLDRLVDLVQRCAADRQNAAETLRHIVHEVLRHQQGILQDDATMVVAQWMTTLEYELTAT
jgi:phosphoserine phosphatase RsbU/P